MGGWGCCLASPCALAAMPGRELPCLVAVSQRHARWLERCPASVVLLQWFCRSCSAAAVLPQWDCRSGSAAGQSGSGMDMGRPLPLGDWPVARQALAAWRCCHRPACAAPWFLQRLPRHCGWLAAYHVLCCAMRATAMRHRLARVKVCAAALCRRLCMTTVEWQAAQTLAHAMCTPLAKATCAKCMMAFRARSSAFFKSLAVRVSVRGVTCLQPDRR
jgi:hypothetical protein